MEGWSFECFECGEHSIVLNSPRAVAAGIRACRRAGLPSPADEPDANPNGLEFLESFNIQVLDPGGRDAALYVRQGCLTLQRSCYDVAPDVLAVEWLRSTAAQAAV